MIRTYDKGIVELEDGSVLNRVEVYCGSGDTKPTSGIVNGSTLTEVDTGKTYLFDESNSSWTEVSTGGGGGGGGASALIVTPNFQTGALNKTVLEIYTASQTSPVLLLMDGGISNNQILYFADITLMADGEHAGEYQVSFFSPSRLQMMVAYAATQNDYPIISH